MTEIARDRWQRPLIVPPEGGKPVAYTRVSTLSKTLDDLNQLMLWRQRKTAEGLLRRPDLLTRLSGAIANGDPDNDWPTKKDLNRICSEAVEAAGASKGASAGTGLHALTEAVDRGEHPEFVGAEDRSRLSAYMKAMAGYTPLDAETFVVCDELQAAGTFDRLWLCPDGMVRVGDLKTGKSEPQYPLATAMQLAIYANGSRYDADTGAREPLHDDLDLSTGLLVHMPAVGGCEVYPLDIGKGWMAAVTASVVHGDIRRWKPEDLIRAQVGA